MRIGVVDTLLWLNQNGIQTIIVSNHLQDRIEKYLNENNLNHYFSAVIGRTKEDGSVLHEQFKETAINGYVKENNFLTKDVLLVGDSTEEIDVARALGLSVVSITGGFVATDRLQAKKPDFLINEINEIKNIITKIWI